MGRPGAFETLQFKSYALSRREQQLCALASQGDSNKEIGNALGIHEGTVKVYMSRVFAKTGLRRHNLPQLLARDHMRCQAIELSEWLKKYGDQLNAEASLAFRAILGTMVAEVLARQPDASRQ